MANGRRIRFVLIDKRPGHVRKVLLFRPAAGGEEIMIPWTHYCSEGVEFVQGTVTSVDSGEKEVRYTDAKGSDARIHYDLLVVAVGGVVRRPDPDQGGIALTDPQAAADIRERWRANLRKAAAQTNHEERKRLMTIAVGERASAASKRPPNWGSRCGRRRRRWDSIRPIPPSIY
ncbi:hypothetical protein LJK87_22515 [Paenibacillus sp. P25]|nr:hypothetical protein LJK87_22515 [Paenibacillus sp. P25]